ncbi:hypothetical protein AMJ80_02145 [bacterium SM23_31]|nr:MAG: hypothetical protein AMJ80_02145 [bacterium SM23_31]
MYTFGPVPSRRLGQSLGVSPIPPKTCTYSCVYCQLGRTNRLRFRRESFFPKEDIFKEITDRITNCKVDYITMVGDGEPTLSADLGWIIKKCKENFSIPVAVITNGSLFFKPDVREDLLEADVVLPSLDAGSEMLFKSINRPHGSINYSKMLHGLETFRRVYSGQLWLEVMLVKGLNDSEEALAEIGEAIKRITPDRLYIVTPVRPPAESWVKPPSPEDIIRAQKILGQGEAVKDREEGRFGILEYRDAYQAIIETSSRHPLRVEQALEIEKAFGEQGVVDTMVDDECLVKVRHDNCEYLLPKSFIRHE